MIFNTSRCSQQHSRNATKQFYLLQTMLRAREKKLAHKHWHARRSIAWICVCYHTEVKKKTHSSNFHVARARKRCSTPTATDNNIWGIFTNNTVQYEMKITKTDKRNNNKKKQLHTDSNRYMQHETTYTIKTVQKPSHTHTNNCYFLFWHKNTFTSISIRLPCHGAYVCFFVALWKAWKQQ